MSGEEAQTSANDGVVQKHLIVPERDPVPSVVDDNPNPEIPAARAAPPAAAPVPEDPVADPPGFTDPRHDIARRAAERRAQSTARNPHIPVDRDSVPEGIGVEGEGEGDESADAGQAEQPQRAASPQQPAQQALAPSQFTLKVNKNEFSATREEVLRYAELTDDDARGLPEAAIVRLAQKNLAAQAYLDEAREESKRARVAGRAPSETSDAERQVAQQPAQTAQRAPADVTDEELEAIQLGDKDEARKALGGVVSRIAAQAFGQNQAEVSMRSVQNEVETAMQRFVEKNPDIAGDEILSASHRAMLVQEAMLDVRRAVPELDDQRALYALNNPQSAMALYQAARSEGRQLRSPAEIFDAAASKLRGKFGGAQQPEPPPALDQRREAKRALVQQPALTDSSSREPVARATGRRDPSEVIRATARARFQG